VFLFNFLNTKSKQISSVGNKLSNCFFRVF